MKKILIISCVIISIFLIYLVTIDRKIYYLAIGDDLTNGQLENNTGYSKYVSDYLHYYEKLETYISDFAKDSYRITDIITDINNNKKININGKEKSLKNALIKADLLTISIGINDITAKINTQNIEDISNYQHLYNNIDEISEDLDELLSLIREYCKEDIFLVGIYYPYETPNPDLNNLFIYMNNRFKDLALQYKINYIDIYDIFSENYNYLSDDNIYPSKEGYEAIANQIIITINNTVLKNS